MNIYKKIGIGCSIFALASVVLYYAALISIPNIVDLNKYKESFAQEIEKQSGFKLSCEDIRFERSLTPYFKVKVHHYVLLYPNGEIFMKINDANLKVRILPLLFKKIIIKDAKFIRPIINITLYKDFSTSLDRYLTGKSVNTGGYTLNSIISDTVCERYKIKFYDETTSKIFYLEGDNLKILDLIQGEKVNVVLKGALFEDDKKYISYDVSIKSYLGEFNNKLTMSPFKQIYDYDVRGNVTGNLEIAKNNNLKGNLLLDDFQLKIDDNILSKNIAKLSFKGEEVEIISSLHTSSKDEVNINGKFNYGKRKYINLVTNAKNINLEKLQKLINVLSQSLNIPNKYPEINIKGLLNADFTIHSDMKKLKSSGKAEIVNAQVSHKDLPYKVDKINSIVNFDNNKIVIEKAQAYVNSTPLNLEGTINEDVSLNLKASSDNLDLNAITKLFIKKEDMPFSFVRGKLSFVSDISGKVDKDLVIDTQVDVKGFSGVEKINKIPVNIQNLGFKIRNDKNKYNGEVLLSDVNLIFNKKPITSQLFKISFDNNSIKIPVNTVNIIDSKVNLQGVISDYHKNITGHVDLSGDILAKNLAQIMSEYINQPYKAVGNIKTAVSLDIHKDNVNLGVKLKANKDNYLSYLVIRELLNKPSIFNIDAQIFGENIHLKDLSITEDISTKPEPKIKITGQVINRKEPELKNLKVQIPQPISASMNFFGGEEVSLSGDLLLNNTLKNPDIKGNIRVQKYVIKKFYTLVRNADISLSNANIRVIAPDVTVNDSKMNLILDVQPKMTDTLTITNAQVNSLNLNLNTLFPVVDKERNPFAAAKINVKKGSATINNFQVADLKSKDISSDFSVKDNILKVERVSATAYNGKVSGSINYDFNHAQLDVNLIGKGLDIKSSLFDLCKLEDNLGGIADFTSSVSLRVGDLESVLKSLSGKVTFNAIDGKMGTLGKFEYYMNAQNLLYHGLLNATLNRIVDAVKPNNTSRYKMAKGRLFFQNGYIIAEEIHTCGQNMSLFIKGRYNMLSNLANIDIYGRISDDIKTKLGSFADVSISELVNGQPSKKNVNTLVVPAYLIDNIQLWNRSDNANTNTFKVNVYGNINYPSAINSFSWVVSDKQGKENLPEFSEIPQSL